MWITVLSSFESAFYDILFAVLHAFRDSHFKQNDYSYEKLKVIPTYSISFCDLTTAVESDVFLTFGNPPTIGGGIGDDVDTIFC